VGEAATAFFFPGLTANVGFWATLALNTPDRRPRLRSGFVRSIACRLGFLACLLRPLPQPGGAGPQTTQDHNQDGQAPGCKQRGPAPRELQHACA
jgi:hypothetical protein